MSFSAESRGYSAFDGPYSWRIGDPQALTGNPVIDESRPNGILAGSLSCSGAQNCLRGRPQADDVAVMLICHNNGRFLAEPIHSVLVQPRPQTEILVVDDALSQDTPAVAAQFGLLSDRSGCVRYERVDVRDVHRARAAGLAATRASLVRFLDADDSLPPDYLEAGVPLLDDPVLEFVDSDCERFGDQAGRN